VTERATLAFMTRTRAILALAAAAFAASVNAATPPPPAKPLDDRKMSTVYVLAHAGAILDLCLASPEAPTFPEAKSRDIQELAARLDKLVRTVGSHYRDAELGSVYQHRRPPVARSWWRGARRQAACYASSLRHLCRGGNAPFNKGLAPKSHPGNILASG